MQVVIAVNAILNDFDFMPIGQAIKKARIAAGMTREQLAEIVCKAPRHIQAIENEGQFPSVELLFQLVTMFDISLDQYIFPEKHDSKSTARRNVDATLDKLSDRELEYIEAMAKGLMTLKGPED